MKITITTQQDDGTESHTTLDSNDGLAELDTKVAEIKEAHEVEQQAKIAAAEAQAEAEVQANKESAEPAPEVEGQPTEAPGEPNI